jgi:hypothetical protein
MKCLALLLFLVVAVPAAAQNVRDISGGRIVDLTYAFDASTVYWPTAEPFKLETDFEGVTDKGYFYSAYRYSAAEHGGTHLDAPVHFAKGRHTSDEIPLEQLIGQGGRGRCNNAVCRQSRLPGDRRRLRRLGENEWSHSYRIQSCCFVRVSVNTIPIRARSTSALTTRR